MGVVCVNCEGKNPAFAFKATIQSYYETLNHKQMNHPTFLWTVCSVDPRSSKTHCSDILCRCDVAILRFECNSKKMNQTTLNTNQSNHSWRFHRHHNTSMTTMGNVGPKRFPHVLNCWAFKVTEIAVSEKLRRTAEQKTVKLKEFPVLKCSNTLANWKQTTRSFANKKQSNQIIGLRDFVAKALVIRHLFKCEMLFLFLYLFCTFFVLS